MISYLESFKARYGMQSEEIVADSGYGSEENYEYMFSNGMTPYVKYNMFHVEQRRSYRNNPFRVSNLFYNPDDDFYVCPMGQKLKFIRQENAILQVVTNRRSAFTEPAGAKVVR